MVDIGAPGAEIERVERPAIRELDGRQAGRDQGKGVVLRRRAGIGTETQRPAFRIKQAAGRPGEAGPAGQAARQPGVAVGDPPLDPPIPGQKAGEIGDR